MRGRLASARSRADALPLAHDFGELALGLPGLALIVDEILVEVAELALARRVVHQRDRAAPDACARNSSRNSTTLGAGTSQRRWVWWSARSRSAARARSIASASGDDLLADARAPVLVFVHADAEGIEHRGDAGGGDLRVIGHHRAAGVPEHARARHEMRLEMVGVQFDQAGQQIVALAVDPALRAAALADLDDAAVVDRDPAEEDAVGGDDLGVGQDEGIGGVEFHASGSVFVEERLGRKRGGSRRARRAASRAASPTRRARPCARRLLPGSGACSGLAGTPATIV